ncbi:MAG: FtsW/RodA/SpoVE family cell cycle protein [Lachnospiraceae bacterium]
MEERTRKRKRIQYTDYTLIFVVLFLLVFGLVMVYSASYYEANETFGKPAYYFNKQLGATLAGLVLMIITIFIPYKFFYRFRWLPLIVSALLLIALKIPFLAYSANGATRWIRVFGVSIQPAEAIKLMIIIYLAGYLTEKANKISSLKDAGITFIPVVAATLAIYLMSNNMSSALIVLGIGFLMLFFAAPDYLKYFIVLGVGMFVVMIIVFVILNQDTTQGMDFRGERILAWRNPEQYADGKGYQTLQALYAIGSGGLWGKGLGESIQKLGFIPEAQNDMIFSIICEELGLFGAAVVLVLFFVLIYRCYFTATHAQDMYGCLLVAGVMSHIALQVVLNVAVVTNLIPNTGISLPFISYGGSSIVFLLIEIGLVINVSKSLKVAE